MELLYLCFISIIKKHNLPHIHVKYEEYEVIMSIHNGEILEGSIPNNKMKLVTAWIEIHKDDLIANWELAINGNNIYPIDPLK